MLEVKVFVECPALEKLAAAISGQNKSVDMPAWCDAVVTDTPEHPTANTAPAAAPAPMQPAAPMPGAVPTAASAPAAPPVMPPVSVKLTPSKYNAVCGLVSTHHSLQQGGAKGATVMGTHNTNHLK